MTRILPRLLATLLMVLSASAQAQEVYFGNLHGHTSYSDGMGVPADAYAMAKAEGLDFFAVTEHNHDKADGKGPRHDGRLIATDPSLYSGPSTSLIATAERMDEPGRFVALYGQEFSIISRGNHINVFDIPQVITAPSGDFKALMAWTDQHRDSSGAPALLQFNHPRAGTGDPLDYGRAQFGDDRAWVEALDPQVELLEVLNAPALTDDRHMRPHDHQREYFGYLNLGFHLAPSLGQDNHFRNWGSATEARVAVIAPALTKTALLTALRQRHAYATEDRNLRIIFHANGALSGDVAPPPAPDSELDLKVSIRDPDEPQAHYRIDVFVDEPGGPPPKTPAETFELVGDTVGEATLDGVRFPGPGAYVFLRVTQSAPLDDADHEGDEDRAWTAPVWFEFAAAAPLAPASTPRLRIASLLPDPPGDDIQNEEVVLRNDGTVPIDLAGWRLKDLADNIWALPAGPLAPGQSLAVRRNGQTMSMNNGGDTIELFDAAGRSIQTVTYGPVSRGEIVTPP